MQVRAVLLYLCVPLSIPAFAAPNDPPKTCEAAAGGIVQEPTIEELRAKYGLPGGPVTFGADTSKTLAGAKFKLDGDFGYRVVLREYSEVQFDWDSPNDHLRLKILRHLSALREAGASESPEFAVNFNFHHPKNGSSVLSINHFEGFF